MPSASPWYVAWQRKAIDSAKRMSHMARELGIGKQLGAALRTLAERLRRDP